MLSDLQLAVWSIQQEGILITQKFVVGFVSEWKFGCSRWPGLCGGNKAVAEHWQVLDEAWINKDGLRCTFAVQTSGTLVRNDGTR